MGIESNCLIRWAKLSSQESERLALLDYPEWMLRPRRERDAEARAKLRASSTHVRQRERSNGPAVARRAPEPAAEANIGTRWEGLIIVLCAHSVWKMVYDCPHRLYMMMISLLLRECHWLSIPLGRGFLRFMKGWQGV